MLRYRLTIKEIRGNFMTLSKWLCIFAWNAFCAFEVHEAVAGLVQPKAEWFYYRVMILAKRLSSFNLPVTQSVFAHAGGLTGVFRQETSLVSAQIPPIDQSSSFNPWDKTSPFTRLKNKTVEGRIGTKTFCVGMPLSAQTCQKTE